MNQQLTKGLINNELFIRYQSINERKETIFNRCIKMEPIIEWNVSKFCYFLNFLMIMNSIDYNDV